MNPAESVSEHVDLPMLFACSSFKLFSFWEFRLLVGRRDGFLNKLAVRASLLKRTLVAMQMGSYAALANPVSLSKHQFVDCDTTVSGYETG